MSLKNLQALYGKQLATTSTLKLKNVDFGLLTWENLLTNYGPFTDQAPIAVAGLPRNRGRKDIYNLQPISRQI